PAPGAASATRSTSACSATPSSCRSPTAPGWPAGGWPAGAPARRSRARSSPAAPPERAGAALADAEPVLAGEVIRIRTTGGGGWGDPLDRPYDEVLRDLRWHKVSVAGARDDYGVGGPGPPRDSPAARD